MESKRYIGKVFGHFRILEPLGKGGMGLVFKALNTHLNKIVAIKMIAPGLALNEKLLNRFKTEALALARLENPHIVRILDLLEDGGQWFIVMEYIEGQTLSDRIKEKRPMQLSEAFDIMFQILSALQHAHSANIIHRDIKPSNILITQDNIVKVTDFGLAKIQANSLVHTQHSAVGGTLYYMSPEQVRSLKDTDHRTDIYSLGITFYQMVTGRIPFEPHQTDFDVREAIVRKAFPKPSTFNPYLPPEIDDLVMKALAKDPDDRFQSAVEMMQEMERIQEKIKNKMDQNVPIIETDIKEEINFDDYPFLDDSKRPQQKESELQHETSAQNANDNGQQPPPARDTHFTNQEGEDRSSFLARFVRHTKERKIWIFAFLLLIFIIAVTMLWQKGTAPPPSKSSTLKIYSEPSAALVNVNGQTVGKTPMDSLAINPGKIQLQLQKNDFLPFDTTLIVKPNVTMILRLALVQKPVSGSITPKSTIDSQNIPVSTPVPTDINISVRSRPSGAHVFVNRKLVGTTPWKSTFARGKQLTIRVEKAGYFPATDTIFIAAKGKRRFEYTLTPKPVTVKIKVQPTPVTLFIDGIKKGVLSRNVTPFSLQPGHHALKLVKANFKSVEKSINVLVNTPRTFTFNLKPLQGKLDILVIPWGNIYIDGTLRKQEANVKQSFTLDAGEHRIKVTHPQFGSCEEAISIKPESTLNLVYDFKKPVPVKVLAFDENGKAQYARIVVDGKPTSQYTPGLIPVPLGKHEISVQKTGFEVSGGAKRFMITPSFNKTVKFTLKKRN